MKNCIVLVVFVIVISFSGCFRDNSKTVLNVPVASKNVSKETAIVKSTQEIYPLDKLKAIDIECITRKGGLYSPKNWAILSPKKDEEKVVKIINLIKSCSNINTSTKDDLYFLNTKHGYPVDTVIRMKDGSQFTLMSAMKLTRKKGRNGTETTGTTYKDHFILAYEKGNSKEYYSIYSNDDTAYILDRSNPDFPRVDNNTITPKDFKYGDSTSVTPIVLTESDMASENSNTSETISPKVINNLKSIEIINMNSVSNLKVNLILPKDWHAKGYICDISKGSEYHSEKNKQIKKVYSFNIYNEKNMDKFNLYGEKGIAGTFEIHGYYRDQPESSRFPNHSNVKCKLFSGRTVLGHGEIFLLNCDLPRELRTEKDTSYEVIYAWIPIENEKLAYNLAISVPLGEKNDDYIRIVKEILEAERIGEQKDGINSSINHNLFSIY